MGIVVALATGTITNGTRYGITVRRGEAWDADDPVVLANPSWFSADPSAARATAQREVVEQATRAPGERSRARRK